MTYDDFLPIGSVVLLKNAQKKIVVIGIMQTKQMKSGEVVAFDYMGVPYPEGYIGPQSAMLFSHESIQEVFHRGYSDEERTNMINMIKSMVDLTDQAIQKTRE